MEKISIIQLFKTHIKNTGYKQPVVEEEIFICHLTNIVKKVCRLNSAKVHITTKILKHLYDKKPAEEFDFIIHYIHVIIKYPDTIYHNKDSKRGDFCFVKKLKEDLYICSIECNKNNENSTEVVNYAITCFRIRDKKYLKNYELLWSWKGGNPSS